MRVTRGRGRRELKISRSCEGRRPVVHQFRLQIGHQPANGSFDRAVIGDAEVGMKRVLAIDLAGEAGADDLGAFASASREPGCNDIGWSGDEDDGNVGKRSLASPMLERERLHTAWIPCSTTSRTTSGRA